VALVRITAAEVFQYTLSLDTPIPLRQGPLTEKTGYLLKLQDDDGHIAWGEAAPLPGFSRESQTACERSLLTAAESLLERDDIPDREAPGSLAAFQTARSHSAAYFAVESAFGQLVAARDGTAPWQAHAPERGSELLLNALLAGEEEEICRQAKRASDLRFRAAKLKVGREKMTEDLRLVEVVRNALGPDMELRLDANQAWSLEDAILFGKAVADSDIAYIEEPCANPFELPSFHEATGLAYAIDESIQGIHDLIHAREPVQGSGPFRDLPIGPVVQGAKAIVWKPTLVHSPELGAFLFRETRPGQTKMLVLSGAFESGVGTAAVANYAAMFSDPGVPVGLDTYRWMEPDILRERLPLDRGTADLFAIHEAAQTVNESRLRLIGPR
jgi:o-succinylbenzoate synthase